MKYQLTTKDVLHRLGIGKTYSGYDYILYGIGLISENEELLNGITKILYIDIAKEFQTTNICVEKNIRKAIEVIWKNAEENEQLITNIFGDKYLSRKPSNKVFFELLYEYVEQHDLLERIFCTEKMICPLSQDVCITYNKIVQELINLE